MLGLDLRVFLECFLTLLPLYVMSIMCVAATLQVSCQSNLQLLSTQGTTQTNGGTQASGLTVSAVPINCPPPALSPTPGAGANGGVTNTGLIRAAEPILTPSITRTYIRGTFDWAVSSSITPTTQPIAQGSSGQLGRYRVDAVRQASSTGADSVQYLIAGSVQVSNPDPLVATRIDEVMAVVDGAAVPLVCNPGLPYLLPPQSTLACNLLVNYNRGAVANTLSTRATITSSAGVRSTVEGAAVRFAWDNADTSQAQGACAQVYQTFATDWFDLMQANGVAPSFTPSEPTTICGPTTWEFDVTFTPRDGAPCGPQQVRGPACLNGRNLSGRGVGRAGQEGV